MAWREILQPVLNQDDMLRVADMVQVSFTRGSWFLMALDEEHTLAEYHSWVDPGGRIPVGPASQFATGGIEKTFMQMESYAKGQKTSICRDAW